MKQKIFLIYSLILAFLMISCAKKEPVRTEVFPPTLSFVETSNTGENSVEQVEEEEKEPEIERVQLVPEYPVVSSFLKEWQGESYNAYSTMDGDISTAWVENVSGLGVNEWVELGFPWPETVQEVAIYSGHGGDKTKAAQFGYVRKIKLSLSNGEEFTYNLEPGWNEIVLEKPVDVTSVRITILQGIAGTTEDVAISEIKLYNTSTAAPTEVLSVEGILQNMGAIGDCSNITPEQAAAFAAELQKVIAWAEKTSVSRAYLGDGYEKYQGEALLFAGGDGIPVLYYDYDFLKVDELFLTSTDVIVWDGETAKGGYFEELGRNTSINWVIPGYVYAKNNEYFFGLTEYDAYGSGTFGLIAMVPFESGVPSSKTAYTAFLSHRSLGVFSYEDELDDYKLMPVLNSLPLDELADIVQEEQEGYYEFNGSHFEEKTMIWDTTDYSTWYTAIRNARIEAGYEQVTKVQSGDTVLAGLLALS